MNSRQKAVHGVRGEVYRTLRARFPRPPANLDPVLDGPAYDAWQLRGDWLNVGADMWAGMLVVGAEIEKEESPKQDFGAALKRRFARFRQYYAK